MVAIVKAPGTNPTVVSAESYLMSYGDNGRTFVTFGTDKNSFVDFGLPTPLVEGFRVRVGVNDAGRPARISNGTIALPRRSSLLTIGALGSNDASVSWLVSYDPGAFLDLVWDPGGDDRWRVVGGMGQWTSPIDPLATYHLADTPAAYKMDFGKPSGTTSEWTPVSVLEEPVGSFYYVAPIQFKVPSTQEMYDLFRPGIPIRFLDTTVEAGWSYGVVADFVANPIERNALVRFYGAPMSQAPLALEVGPREALRRITVTIPGNFNAVDDAALIQHVNSTFLTWTEGDAALVRVSTICILADTAEAPAISVSFGGVPALTALPTVTAARQYTTVMDPTVYSVAFDDAIELEVINVVGGPVSNKDAEDLTVELLFVQDRKQSFWDNDSPISPAMNMVVSGALGYGGALQQLGNGVHAITPSSYAIEAWTTTSTTGTSPTHKIQTRHEAWMFNPTTTYSSSYPISYLKLWALARRKKSPGMTTMMPPVYTGTTSQSLIAIKGLYGSGATYFTDFTISPHGTGRITNKYMRAITFGPTTFTWWKLGTVWGLAFR